jgi:hypothetical protein
MDLATVLDTYCHHRQQRDTAARDTSKFRVSDAGKCRLMRYWKRQGKDYTLDIPPKALRAMDIGIHLHEWIQGVLQDQVDLIYVELEVSDEHRLGHLDALVEMGGRTFLYDFKFVNGKKMYYLTKNGTPEADKQHAYQIVTYADMITMLPDELRVAYIDRDSLDILEIPVEYDQMRPAVFEDWDTLIAAWSYRNEPRANPQYWECRYCIYKDVCDQSPFVS